MLLDFDGVGRGRFFQWGTTDGGTGAGMEWQAVVDAGVDRAASWPHIRRDGAVDSKGELAEVLAERDG